MKLMIAAAVAVLVAMIAAHLIGEARVKSLERDIEMAKAVAEKKEAAANESEMKAVAYEKKVAYLEAEIARIGQIARRQDDELEKMESSVNGARADVERARSIRTSRTTADELCERLRALGHPCD